MSAAAAVAFVRASRTIRPPFAAVMLMITNQQQRTAGQRLSGLKEPVTNVLSRVQAGAKFNPCPRLLGPRGALLSIQRGTEGTSQPTAHVLADDATADLLAAGPGLTSNRF